MSYTKTYTYTNGTTLTASDQTTNDDGAKKAINQDTVQADLATDGFDYDSIQRGELEPITNHHQFTTGEIYGNFSDVKVRERAYFTSLIKANNQTGSLQYVDLFDTGSRIVLEDDANLFITFGGAFVSDENSTVTFGPGRGRWDSTVILKIYNEDTNSTTYIDGTVAYSFEETTAASAGTYDPGTLTLSGKTNRRWIGWEWMTSSLSSGAYRICLVIDPKVEQGFSSARSYTIECFYT